MLSKRRVVVIVFAVAVVLRVGYGVVRYRDAIVASGDDFIALWDYDAIEHVLIARAILTGKGYVVDPEPDLTGKHVRAVGQEALFKAPLYQYLLAVIFGLSGLTLALLLPLQALLGGILSVVVAIISLAAFEDRRASLLAGLAAATHPVLVNTASQPYNENLFFLLWLLVVWAFIRWLTMPSWMGAMICGATAGVTALTRESVLVPFGAMVIFAVATRWRKSDAAAMRYGLLMFAGAVIVISPWTLHNYVRFGVMLPITSISGTVFGAGNNECVAAQDLLSPFYGDDPCPSLDQKRAKALQEAHGEPRAVANDRVYARLGLRFVRENPGDYLRLCLRRAWTILMPYHPRSNLGPGRKTLLVVYTIVVFWAGAIFAVGCAESRATPIRGLLLVAVAASLIPLVMVFVSHDLRFRVGTDLLFGCFAGEAYSRLLAKRLRSRRR